MFVKRKYARKKVGILGIFKGGTRLYLGQGDCSLKNIKKCS